MFQKKKTIDGIQAYLTGTITKQSYSGRENNPYSSHESEEQEAEETNFDAYVTSEAKTIGENKNNMIILLG